MLTYEWLVCVISNLCDQTSVYLFVFLSWFLPSFISVIRNEVWE